MKSFAVHSIAAAMASCSEARNQVLDRDGPDYDAAIRNLEAAKREIDEAVSYIRQAQDERSVQ